MATAEEIKKELEKWAGKLDDPDFAEEFDGFNKTMQFSFPDLDYKLKMVFKDKKATVEEGFDEDAAMSLDVNSDLFLGICTGEIDPMEAFMSGELKPKGTMGDLEKLEIFMDEMD